VFTGIIEGLRQISSVRRLGESGKLGIDLGELLEGVSPGDSIAVNGACLTVVRIAGAVATFDLSRETLNSTALGELSAGGLVNIERSLKLGGRLGGHIVQGHVDGVGAILRTEPGRGQTVIRFSVEPQIAAAMILKGSVAVDGISLTISALDTDWFEVTLIPHTLAMTTLNLRKVGDHVNIETDMIGKYVRRFLESDASGRRELTIEKLRSEGFA